MEAFTQILNGDAEAALANWPAESIQTCITSPPYFALRNYGHDGQIGNEETPAGYVASLQRIFRAVFRVLRPDGTLWLNIGDTYARDPGKGQHKPGQSGKQSYVFDAGAGRASGFVGGGAKAKDLLGIPWMVAFALRDSGWFLRNEVIWHKPNGMTESAHDRITRAHEQVFLFSKSSDYFFDDVAIMEPTVDGKGMRQCRDVWTIPVARYKGAHFAVYPELLVERPILASTSEKGQCAICGTPHGRDVVRTRAPTRPGLLTKATGDGLVSGNRDPGRHCTLVETVAWSSRCSCPIKATPQWVLDPFMGSGTTGVVANRLGRNCLGVEVNPEYIPLALKRLEEARGAKDKGKR